MLPPAFKGIEHLSLLWPQESILGGGDSSHLTALTLMGAHDDSAQPSEIHPATIRTSFSLPPT